MCTCALCYRDLGGSSGSQANTETILFNMLGCFHACIPGLSGTVPLTPMPCLVLQTHHQLCRRWASKATPMSLCSTNVPGPLSLEIWGMTPARATHTHTHI